MPLLPPSSGSGDANRRAVLHTPSGRGIPADMALSLMRFHGVEAMNEPYRFEVDCISAEASMDLDKCLGREFWVEVKPLYPDLAPRYFDGVLTEAQWLGEVEGGIGYRLVLRPRLWLATLSARQRIFHKKPLQQIIQKVLSDHDVTAEFEGGCGSDELEYTVQLNETDFDFVSRLMQKYGLNYWFRHVGGGHSMVVTDSNSTLPWIEGNSRSFAMVVSAHHGSGEYLDSLSVGRAMTTGQVKLTDYNFTSPRAKCEGEHDSSHAYEGGKGVMEVYPAGFGNLASGGLHRTMGQIRGRQAAARDRIYHASGNLLSLAPGMRIEVEGEPLPDGGNRKEFVALRCVHSFSAESYRSGAGMEDGPEYEGQYDLLPFETQVVPPKAVPEPRILGPHTAEVVGDGEIDCDEHGRILVRFHWDKDDVQSMRCRVLQPWAGNGWGSLMIPRVGMEVVVEFLDGDPDRPIVTGAVYNGDNRPPVDLPGDKAQSGFRSQSLGGGGYNEFIIDDSDGKELMRIHAQKDLQTKVLNDEKREVEGDRESDVDGNDKLTVGKALTITATDSITLQVGGSKVEITPQKVTISANMVEVSAGIELKTSGGAAASHKAGGQMEIKAPLVMIN